MSVAADLHREGMCPSCGFNLTADKEIQRDGWRISPGVGVYYRDQLVTRRESWTQILLAVAKAGDRATTTEVLLNRLGTDTPNTIASHVSQMRRAFGDSGFRLPIKGRLGRSAPGYRWEAQ